MAIYLEQRFYSREEIATLFSLDASNQNFSRQIKSKLKSLGYEIDKGFAYSRKGITIIWTPQTREEKITYLVRKLGIDSHVDPIGFATFIERMCGDPLFQTAPWNWRSEQLHLSIPTLQSWFKKLNEFNLFSKTKNSTQIWKTFYDGSEKIQVPIHPADPGYLGYLATWATTFEKNNKDWTITNKLMWQQYHCKYFKCYTMEVNGINTNEDIIELLNVIKELL